MVQRNRVEIYEDRRGRRPFLTWLYGLKDRSMIDRIRARVARIADGNLGDHRALGEGLYEMRVFHGPGYRLYFTMQGERLVLLLCGGSKGSQARDVARARSYLRNYLGWAHGAE